MLEKWYVWFLAGFVLFETSTGLFIQLIISRCDTSILYHLAIDVALIGLILIVVSIKKRTKDE